MFKLVKNKVPEELKAKGQICDYATINTKELFLAFVRGTLVDSVNEYLETDNLESLVDIKILLDTLIKEIGQEEFNKVRDFMHSVGLPLTLEEVGITKEDVHQVAVASCVPGESIHNLSGDVSVKELEQAILLVDALDHDYLNNK